MIRVPPGTHIMTPEHEGIDMAPDEDRYDTARARQLNLDGRAGDYYDRQGRRIGLGDWAERIEDFEYKRVRQDDLILRNGRTVFVSTVWLGLDHGFGMGGPPLIFETMVFDRDEDGRLGEVLTQERYSDEATAAEAHRMLVARLRGVCVRCELDLGAIGETGRACPRCGV